jgi:ABC-type microcin C transport system permease subunit YejE
LPQLKGHWHVFLLLLLFFVSLFTGKSPAITKYSSKTAFGNKVYANDKIKASLNFQFRNLNDTIENAINGKIE